MSLEGSTYTAGQLGSRSWSRKNIRAAQKWGGDRPDCNSVPLARPVADGSALFLFLFSYPVLIIKVLLWAYWCCYGRMVLTEFTATWVAAWGSRSVLWFLYINCFLYLPFVLFDHFFCFVLCISSTCTLWPDCRFLVLFLRFLACNTCYIPQGPSLHARKTNNSPTILAAHPLVNLLQRSDAFRAMLMVPWVDNTVYHHWIVPCLSFSVGWLFDLILAFVSPCYCDYDLLPC